MGGGGGGGGEAGDAGGGRGGCERWGWGTHPCHDTETKEKFLQWKIEADDVY